jgi:hypothetical protein
LWARVSVREGWPGRKRLIEEETVVALSEFEKFEGTMNTLGGYLHLLFRGKVFHGERAEIVD